VASTGAGGGAASIEAGGATIGSVAGTFGSIASSGTGDGDPTSGTVAKGAETRAFGAARR